MTRTQLRPFRGAVHRPRARYREFRRPDQTAESILGSVDVLAFYREALGHLAGGGDWRTARCPFHDDRHASFRVNVQHGGFSCLTCGVKGGNVARFVMERDGLSFREALGLLEGWNA